MSEPGAAPKKAEIWPVFVGFGAAVFVVQLVGTILLAALFFGDRVRAGEPLLDADLAESLLAFVLSPKALLAAAGVSALTLLGASLVGAWLSKLPLAVRLRTGQSSLGIGRGAVAALGVIAISWGYSAAISLAGLNKIGTLQLFDKMFERPSLTFRVLAILFIGIAAPLGEEAFFRGFMLTRLAQRWHKWFPIFVTSALFGLLHLDLIQGPFALLAGLYLGWLTESTGSIRPAVVAHAANNCLSVVMLQVGLDAPSRTSLYVQVGIAILALVAAVLVIRGHHRTRSIPPSGSPGPELSDAATGP